MNWYQYMEQKRTLLIGGIVIICLAMLFVTMRRNVVSFDGFWHLQTGLDWLKYGLSPWQDHYSFTFNGEAITNPPYLFQALLAWLVTKFGLEPGFQIYRFASFLFLFGLLVVFLRRLRVPVMVYCLVLPLVVVLLQFRTVSRPELIDYAFCILAMQLYYRTRNEMSTAGMLPIIGFMWLWNNYHQPIFGYIIFFAYFIDIALKQLHDRAPPRVWLQWLGWGIAIVAVGFLTPDLKHPLEVVLFSPPEGKELIGEFWYYDPYLASAAFYGLIAITAVTLALLAWKRQFGLLIVCFVLVFHSVDIPRIIVPSGIVILCAFAWMMSEFDLEDRLRHASTFHRNALGSLVFALVVIFLVSGVNGARSFMVQNESSRVRYPEDVVEYMIDHNISGRIFNVYETGGHLIYHLSPGTQVYIDGRTSILYPFDHLKLYFEAVNSPDKLRSEIEKYNIDLVLLENSLHTFVLMNLTGGLGLDFVGANFSLFKKSNPNFPLLGTLLSNPACWSEELSTVIEDEQSRAPSVLPDYSPLLPFMYFVTDFNRADDKSVFLNSLDPGNGWTDFRLRFAGFQALHQNLNPLANQFFSDIAAKTFSDNLAGALAKVRMGEWRAAEQLLDWLTRNLWSEKTHEILILHGLLVQISQNIQLELFDDAYLDKLAREISLSGDSISSFVPDTRSFCPES
jgi:hypothetical protein